MQSQQSGEIRKTMYLEALITSVWSHGKIPVPKFVVIIVMSYVIMVYREIAIVMRGEPAQLNAKHAV